MNWTAVLILRWTARLTGVAIILLFPCLFLGRDGLSESDNLNLTRSILPVKWLMTMGFYIVGWKREQLAGIAIVMLYMIHGVISPDALLLPLWIVMALPGLIYILCSIEWDAQSRNYQA